MGTHDQNPNTDESGTAILEPETIRKADVPRQFKIVILNDDFTPMEFVVQTLSSVFRLTVEAATMKMLEIHREGSTNFSPFTKDVAESKAAIIMDRAVSAGHPLQAYPEPL